MHYWVMIHLSRIQSPNKRIGHLMWHFWILMMAVLFLHTRENKLL